MPILTNKSCSAGKSDCRAGPVIAEKAPGKSHRVGISLIELT